ncbi:hypothetical protein VIBNISO65_1470029 [Vibrio nigripulchritudo SO65]|nr:hypothetical protein VIBNIAM115_100017 [Vibrio nigripulchritudo AM115]CCN41043.1 hypothetical protein VIBNIFTn2_1460029 [Vibrio nigripulchritudo FTn2]CCN65160.1 hypothetical protein VIBNIPon4_350029 [Vibrio nigripulchritudo POn4]CCN75954.1 hypothetical protein VIBNISO65_1470029 [Vibrio nigripulchritudo SO65]
MTITGMIDEVYVWTWKRIRIEKLEGKSREQGELKRIEN